MAKVSFFLFFFYFILSETKLLCGISFRYKEAAIPPALWLEQSLNTFKEALLNLSNPNRPPSHAPLGRTPNNVTSPTNLTGSNPVGGTITPPTPILNSPLKNKVLENFSKLMTSCVIVKVEDFTLYRVTTSGKKQMPKEFISGKFYFILYLIHKNYKNEITFSSFFLKKKAQHKRKYKTGENSPFK